MVSDTGQIPLDFEVRPAMEREDFFIAESNREVVGWLDKWPNWPAPALIIYGPEACGKTHLLHVWQEKSGADLVDAKDLNEAFVADFTGQIRPLAIDNLQDVMGDEGVENALFHLYNLSKEHGVSLLISSENPVSSWPIGLPDLRSRLMAAPAAGVLPPDDDLLTMVLMKHFADHQLTVSQEVILYILPRMERSMAAAQKLVDDIDRLALSQKRRVTVPLVKQVLSGN